jgi:hypothetical protein
MRSASFAERLDAHVTAQHRWTALPLDIATSAWIGPAVPWFPGATRFRASSDGSRHDTPPKPAAPCTRQLTARERQALDLLASASACVLDASFDARLLRRAFRTAARRLHPDAHPAAAPVERERLGAAFAAARAAYLILLPLGKERRV